MIKQINLTRSHGRLSNREPFIAAKNEQLTLEFISDYKLDDLLTTVKNGKLATATDPTAEWTIRNAGLGSPSNVISDLVYANGIWVIVAGGGNGAYAVDPTKDWIPLSGIVPSALTAVHIAYGNATWVAVGLSGNMAISYPAL